MVGDGCGGSDDCGACPQGQVCTVSGGQPNRCAWLPAADVTT
jgi:hypothetical protein